MREGFAPADRRPSDVEEAELLARAQAGDRDAIEALLERHEPQIYRYALRMCGAPEDARDVLQETLLAAFRGLDGFRGEARLTTWLYQVARSFCGKATRRRVGEPARYEALDGAGAARLRVDAEQHPDALAHAREIGEVLRVAMASMPAPQREVLVLRDVQGLSLEEVAEILGKSLAATKSALHRARFELRGRLQGVLGEGEPMAPCPELAAELSGYAAGEVGRETCARLEGHLARCPRCRDACESLKTTLALCSRCAEGDELPAPVQSAVRRLLRELAPR